MSDAVGRTLPSGWTTANMAEIGFLFCGQSPPSAAVNTQGRGTPYVSGPDHWDGSVVQIDKWTTAPSRIVPDGTVFVTVKGAGVGTVFPGVPAAIGRDIYAFMPESGVSPSFITHALRFTTSEIVRQAQGDIPGLSKAHILQHPISLPPAREQERIASAVDEALSDIDAGVAAIDRARTKLAHYRAAVLKAAVEGALTAEWRQQHPSSGGGSELLERILSERRGRWDEEQNRKLKRGDQELPKNWKRKYREPVAPGATGLPQLPNAWCWASIDHILREPLRNGHSAKTASGGTGVSTFSLSAVTNRDFSDDNIKITVADPEKVRDLWAETDDIFVQRSNTPELVGTTGRYQGKSGRAIFPDLLIRIRVAPPILPAFVELCLRSNLCHSYFRRKAQGISGSMPKIDQDVVQRTAIPLSSVAEQQVIVEAVEDQFSIIDHLEADLATKLEMARTLRHAILRHAFTGQLVLQDPNDEPASELPKRIAAEREVRAQRTTALRCNRTKTAGARRAAKSRPS